MVYPLFCRSTSSGWDFFIRSRERHLFALFCCRFNAYFPHSSVCYIRRCVRVLSRNCNILRRSFNHTIHVHPALPLRIVLVSISFKIYCLFYLLSFAISWKCYFSFVLIFHFQHDFNVVFCCRAAIAEHAPPATIETFSVGFWFPLLCIYRGAQVLFVCCRRSCAVHSLLRLHRRPAFFSHFRPAYMQFGRVRALHTAIYIGAGRARLLLQLVYTLRV